MGKKRALYGICRIDNAVSRTHGWVVTIQRRGVIYRRQFSDARQGGKSKALAAAKRYRDEIVESHPPLTRAEHAEIFKRNNKSGVVGVCRCCATETRDKPLEMQRWFWLATWTLPNGRARRIKFSVRKYGEKHAFRLALQMRKAAVRAMPGNFDPGTTRVRLGKSRMG